jgi:hypothetical protein
MPTVDLLVAEETVENMEINIGRKTTLMESLVSTEQGGEGDFCNGKMQWKNAMENAMKKSRKYANFLYFLSCHPLFCHRCCALVLTNYLKLFTNVLFF